MFGLGKKHYNWKGGVNIHNGYRLVLKPSHPMRDHHGYVREHRLVMEKKLGRYLLPNEVVHHINGDRLDNRIENLQLMSKGKHTTITHSGLKWLGDRKKQSETMRSIRKEKKWYASTETRKKISLGVSKARENKFWSSRGADKK